MSQAKVEKYKQEKANRKKIMKKEKRMHILRVILASLVGLVIVGFLVWSVVDKYNDKNNSTEPITLSEEEMSSLMEQINSTTGSEEGSTKENGSTEKASDEVTSSEKASDEETSSEKASDEETSSEKASDEEGSTEAAE